MRAVLVPSAGGPDVLTLQEIPAPRPKQNELLVALSVSGINFLDVYQRSGSTPLQPPFCAGVEGVGQVLEVGTDVEGFAVGDRVGWLSGGQGTFADLAVVDVDKAVLIPDLIDDETAAALLMQGVTAHYLATDTYRVGLTDTVLVHAAAGGVGQMLAQVARIRGAMVLGTVSTPAKERVARKAGVDHVLSYDNFVTESKDITDGQGVIAVYDGIGAATFEGSLASLRPRGTLAVYGTASGPVPPLDVARLGAGGSLFVTRPSVAHYTRTPQELRERTSELFRWIAAGRLRVSVGGRYPLDDVQRAFDDLESRRSTGKLLLVH